jgi:hypothetical protein
MPARAKSKTMTRAGTPALFGPPADVPACLNGSLCGAPEAQDEPPAEDVNQANMGLPAPGGWLWAGLGLVGGYVLHDMLMKKGKR